VGASTAVKETQIFAKVGAYTNSFTELIKNLF
jgi:hypothetical protein